ncbi:hypothetical protein NDA10_005466 [Ustilago hordei]|uniref:Autophagy-related protein 14 n=1 Tax=Ustilago hordei TaxID=120017 RepID=I2G031_USTHO|nr:uncharacterized protein UHO2_03684 [Ustilago hordei]KAJ1044079.1 hypothetical protein NDA10_005466 [Ustilago hordei]CCF52524.1 uncharacterized protein UHOR_04630 [Ustilago hordei]SYW75605.1 uncharacterized protein UHO2_03684 [Ustilago hordei]
MSISTGSDSAHMAASTSSQPAIHTEQRRIGHICAILVRNLSIRPTRDRALQTLTSKRPGGSSRYHTTSDDADLTLSLARSNSKGKSKAGGSHCPRRSASYSRLDAGSSDDDNDAQQLESGSPSSSTPTRSQLNNRNKLHPGSDRRGRSGFQANQRHTSDHELTTTNLSSAADDRHSIEASPRPILKRSSSTRDGRVQNGSPGGGSTGFLDELGAHTTMLSRSDSRSSSHSSHTIRRPSHRARTTSMTSSSSVRNVRFDESHVGNSDEARRPSRITGRLNAASRYMLFSQKSLAQIMKDRMLECYVELSLADNDASVQKGKMTSDKPEPIFYRTPNSKPGLHHSWGYQGGDPISPERDFATAAISSKEPLEASTVEIKIWARSPPDTAKTEPEAEEWKLVRRTSVDLRDLEPISGSLQDANLALPPNSILLGLALGANSLSGRTSLSSADSQKGLSSPTAKGEGEVEPKLKRKISEQEAERTRHILESIVYYAVPLDSAQGADAGQASRANGSASLKAESSNRKQAKGNLGRSRSPNQRRRASVDGYASDPENASNHKAIKSSRGEDELTIPAPTTSTAATTAAISPATSDAPRRERRKAFEDEQRRVLELSLRETKMMPSYTLDRARQLASKQTQSQNLLAQVDELCGENGELLQDPEGIVQLRLKHEQQKAHSEAVRQMATDEAADLAQRRAELETRRAALQSRRKAMQASDALFWAAETSSRQLQGQLDNLKAEKADLSQFLHAQQSSLLRDLEIIFPIELSDASSLLFSICGLPLPNSVASLPPTELLHEEKKWKDTVKRLPASNRPVFHPFDDDTISSSFGLVAQLVVLLSTYLSTPIHYPLATAGSRAVLQDGISLMSGPRAFPLYEKGMERYRYEYAAFLLNKDIEQLMNVWSVTVIDIRHTLPNLKNLMVTVSAAGPGSEGSRKSYLGKREISLRSAVETVDERIVGGDGGKVNEGKRPGTGLGMGLPSTANGRVGKLEAKPDTLVTTRVLGASSKAAAAPATASGAIASVSRAFSYFSGSSTR